MNFRTDPDMGPNARQRAEAEVRSNPGRMVCSVCCEAPADCRCRVDFWYGQKPPIIRADQPIPGKE